LREAIFDEITKGRTEASPQTIISNLRHKRNLGKAWKALERAKYSAYRDLMVVDLREAVNSLKEIIGEVTTEDILDEIFSQFCIGK
jgi:tRNA modification GTPase